MTLDVLMALLVVVVVGGRGEGGSSGEGWCVGWALAEKDLTTKTNDFFDHSESKGIFIVKGLLLT